MVQRSVSLGVALGLFSLALTAGAAHADEANGGFVFGGLDISSDSDFAYLGGGFRPGADIDSDGLMLRVAGAYGEYRYDRGALLPRGKGRAETLDLMVGWQHASDTVRVSLYVGGAYEHHSIKNDPTNPVQGAKWGAKGQIEVYAQPSPNSMFLGIASYSGANKTYFGLAKAGWRVSEKSVYFGPEVGVNGNERYDQVRGGVHVTGYQVGPVGFSASVGYVKNSPGDGGAYGGVGFTFRY